MTPTATYRLQLQPDFPFPAAARAVPYLAGLGVSHLHLSPVLEAVPGSRHGYDVVDHGRVRDELGGEEGLRELARTARSHGLGLVVDIVPNHMAADPRHNHALREVLREGPASRYARWFDIDWEAGGGKVLLPVLGGRIGEEMGRFRVDADREVLCLDGQEFPLRAGTAGLPLPELLDAQHYRLGWWRLARTELNYRRFFTVSGLIGVRVEDPEVFDATHATILGLVRDGVVDGLRVDHPDGLADPAAYLERLSAATGGRWTVVEKILTGEEQLPARWAVAGTTGYDALHRIDGLFVDPAGAAELTGRFREYAGPAADRGGDWTATVRRAAYEVVTDELAAETALLTRMAVRICAAEPALRDHAPWALRTAVRELLVRVPVYRPYVSPPSSRSGEEALPEAAVRDAKAVFAVAEESAAVDVVRDLALGRLGGGPRRAAFCARFAQTASALRAKSVEDTAYYRYTPLVSANEVGGDPGRPATDPDEFHAFCARLARDWPGTGTVLTTHDTKRSADVRARVAVLTECPRAWSELLTELGRAVTATAPDAQFGWLSWQTAVGCTGVPDGEQAGRLEPALLKAVREAGLFTSWTESDPVYERAVTDFVAAGPAAAGGPVREALERFAHTLAPYVRANVLGAALVQLTMPGVPDLYQGTEREYLALVDPDNRRPFREPDRAPYGATDGASGGADEKAVLTSVALRLRRERPEVFGASRTYAPLGARGPAAAHCVAFCRSGEVVTAVTRLSSRLAESGGWRGTELALPDDGEWADLLAPGRKFSGGSVVLAELFAKRPVALLSRA
ncbi:malto-oligosyltrehalose synthase [Streptomyces sp. NPDC056347]|uniref:malto-oligosyltrehalose synthase n=1 Tax=Streptomyces sp. NPDC056347 TaxID=3345790 RepID=UPI0035E1B61D